MKTANGSGAVSWSGMVIELLDALAYCANFTLVPLYTTPLLLVVHACTQLQSLRVRLRYTIVEPEDRNWGGADDAGNWNGMVGMVTRGEVDFAAAKFTITSSRDAVIDYSWPFWQEPAVIVMNKPFEEKVFTYLGPFRLNH